ncbi:acyltransferase family protein, partial [Rhodococcus cerastii]
LMLVGLISVDPYSKRVQCPKSLGRSLGVRAEGWVGQTFGWLIYGHFGVTIFIVLAGWLLAGGVAAHRGSQPGGWINYMIERSWRIIPPYWIALAFSIVLVIVYIGEKTGTHWDLVVPTNQKSWAVNALLLQDVLPVQNVAYTFWSISLEWHIYLLLPIILLLRRLSGQWSVAVAGGVAIGLAGLGLFVVAPSVFGRFHFEYYVLFALAVGAKIATVNYPHIVAKVPLRSLAALAAVTVVALCAIQPYLWVEARYWWIDIVGGVAVVALIATLDGGQAGPVRRVLSWRPLVFTASFSYSLYLIHAPLLQVGWQALVQPLDLDRPAQWALIALVICPAVLGASYVFSRFAERPFTRSGRAKWLHRHQPRRSGRSIRHDATMHKSVSVAVVLIVVLGVAVVGGLLYDRHRGEVTTEEPATATASTPAFNPLGDVSGRQILTIPENPQVLIMGDSYTEGYAAADQLEQGWARLVVKRLGGIGIVDGVGGTGWTWGGGDTGTDPLKYSDRIARIAAEGSLKPDVLWIQGGQNDYRADPETLSNTVVATIEQARAAWPNVQVVVMGPSAPQPLGYELRVPNDAIIAGAIAAKAAIINPTARDWFTDENSPGFAYSDGAHLNTEGHRYLADRVLSYIPELGFKLTADQTG